MSSVSTRAHQAAEESLCIAWDSVSSPRHVLVRPDQGEIAIVKVTHIPVRHVHNSDGNLPLLRRGEDRIGVEE